MLLSFFCFPKVVKMAIKKIENRFDSQNVKMLARDVTIFSGENVSVVFFVLIISNAAAKC